MTENQTQKARQMVCKPGKTSTPHITIIMADIQSLQTFTTPQTVRNTPTE